MTKSKKQVRVASREVAGRTKPNRELTTHELTKVIGGSTETEVLNNPLG